uniref:stage II sporulation protein M n=1 Tax=Acetatifactor sp. TaxID=1872090 RepID=UPI004056AC85
LLENTGLLDEYTLYHMKNMTVDSGALFYYVLRKRFVSVIILAVLATTYLGSVACGVVSCWYGICAGAFLGAVVIRYGIKGILLMAAGMFPQYLVYIPAMIGLLYWCRNVYKMIYLERTCGWDGAKPFVLPKSILQLVMLMILFLVGCIFESFLNPFCVRGILHLF